MSSTNAAVGMDAVSSVGVWDQFHQWLKWIKIAAFAAVGMFVLIVATQSVQIYRLAADVHPWLGNGIVLLFIAGSLLVIIPAYRFFSVPRVVSPPLLPPREEVQLHHLKDVVRFLHRYLANCQRNPALASRRDAIATAQTQLQAFEARLTEGSSNVAELSDELSAWAHQTSDTVLSELDEQAEKIIYRESLQVGLGTAVSPNGTLDAFVMLWRSVSLASRLANLYYGRPGVWGTLTICRDVSIATAAAAYMQQLTDSLGNVVAKSVGGIAGVVSGPAVEGVTNALALIRIGYLTQERCRTFRQWDRETQKSALNRALEATKKVAVGLTAEIFRQVGTGIGAVAGKAASGLSQAAGAAASGIADLGKKVTSVFRKTTAEEASEGATQPTEESPQT